MSVCEARRGAGHLWAGATVLLTTAVALTGCSASASGDAPDGSASGIGAWPTFLPSPTPQADPTGTLDSPAMSYPGSPVAVHVGTTTALVNVQGPSYPPKTRADAEQVRCTFTVTISQVSAPLSMATATFSVLDAQGGLHPLSATPHHAPPDRLQPGHTYTLSLVGVLPTGEGLLRYYPTTEGAVAAWDFVAETD
jgi:hypothetical protein